MRVSVLARSSCFRQFCKPSQFTYNWLELKGSDDKGLDRTDRFLRDVAQLVEHMLWEHEVTGSNPAIPIKKIGPRNL